MSPRADDATLDVGLRVLDHQIVGSQDELLGNVDNAVLEELDGVLTLTGLVTGPAGLGPRLGGRLDTWVRSIWKRLRPEGDPAPVVIPMAHVLEIGSAIRIDPAAQQVVADAAQLAPGLRYYLISRTPGATGGDDRLAGEPIGATGPVEGEPLPRIPRSHPPGHLVSDLIGATVRGPDGSDLGVVLDLATRAPVPVPHHVGPLVVTTLLVGRRRLGAEMGYATQQDQGPWLIAAPLRAWRRRDRVVLLDDVADVDWRGREVVLARTDRARRPFDD